MQNGFALWDAICSCEISGSSDSGIKNVAPNDLSIMLNCAKIERVFANGQKARSLYKKYLEEQTECRLPALNKPRKRRMELREANRAAADFSR